MTQMLQQGAALSHRPAAKRGRGRHALNMAADTEQKEAVETAGRLTACLQPLARMLRDPYVDCVLLKRQVVLLGFRLPACWLFSSLRGTPGSRLR